MLWLGNNTCQVLNNHSYMPLSWMRLLIFELLLVWQWWNILAQRWCCSVSIDAHAVLPTPPRKRCSWCPVYNLGCGVSYSFIASHGLELEVVLPKDTKDFLARVGCVCQSWFSSSFFHSFFFWWLIEWSVWPQVKVYF